MKKLIIAIALSTLAACAGVKTGDSSDPAALISQAEAAVKKAGSANGEWRDSAEMIAKAKAALEAGDKGTATKLALTAKRQGEMGYEQAVGQKNAGPWLF